jgi:hypothetical protein
MESGQASYRLRGFLPDGLHVQPSLNKYSEEISSSFPYYTPSALLP